MPDSRLGKRKIDTPGRRSSATDASNAVAATESSA